MRLKRLLAVMPAPVAGSHVFLRVFGEKDMDGRDKARP
jgi:hypothetical protein